jgi:hypothetical protein
MALALRRSLRSAGPRRDGPAAASQAPAATTAGSGGTVAPAAATNRPARTRVAAARGAWAIGSLMLTIARIVRLIAGVIVALIVVAIVLRLLGANASNTIVRDIHDAGGWFAGPFKGMFSPHSAKLAMTVNWGIAAVVYLVVGGVIAGFIARLAPRGVPPTEPVV